MRVRTRDGTPVEIEIEGSAADDIQITSAEFIGNSRSGYPNRGRNVTDADIEYIEREYADSIYMEWMESQIGRAEAMADAWRDGTY